MPEINIDVNYKDHPEVRRLCAILGPEAVGLPILLWLHVGKFHFHDAMLLGYEDDELMNLIGWWGDPAKAIAALLHPKVRFLERVEGGFVVRKFLEWNGHLKAMSTRGKKGATARWQKISGDENGKQDARAAVKHREPAAQAMQEPVLGNALTYETSDTSEASATTETAVELPLDPSKPCKCRSQSDLAKFYVSLLNRNPHRDEDLDSLCGYFDDIIASGVSIQAIETELRRRGKSAEKPWELKKRLVATSRSPPGATPSKHLSNEERKRRAMEP